MTTATVPPQLDVGGEPRPRQGADNALATDESFADYKRRYDQLYGPTYLDNTFKAITVRANRFVALLMVGDDVADAVVEALPRRPLPIFALRQGVRVLMTAPPAPDDDLQRCKSVLFDAHVTVAGDGAALALPTPGNGTRYWLDGEPPVDSWLPSYREVVDVIGAKTARRRGLPAASW
ncbi:hypothetical protein [Nocardia nova]|uniref:hypothetical protein n=1 Tax=Nocardia nova TaxID=37330 RepID=UPI0011B02507|nr:hypothetical protein [Nocardia nova]